MKPLAPWLLALALVVGLVLTVRDTSFARAEARRWRVTADSLAKVGARIETTYVRRVDTLYRRITRIDTLTRTVHSWKHDTTEVVRYVMQTDSALRACRSVVETCDERDANKNAQLAALNNQLRAEIARRPTLLDKAKSTALTIIVWEGGKAIVRTIATP